MKKFVIAIVSAVNLAIAFCLLTFGDKLIERKEDIIIVSAVNMAVAIGLLIFYESTESEDKKNRKKPYSYGVGYKLIIIDELPDSKPEKHDDSVDHECRAADYAARMATPIKDCSNFTTIPGSKAGKEKEGVTPRLQEAYLRNACTINKIRDYLVQNFSELCKGKSKMPEFRATLSFNEAMRYLSKNEGWNLTRLDSDRYIEMGYYLTSFRNEEEAEMPFSISMVRVHSTHGSKLYHTFHPLMEDFDSKGWIAFKF